MMPLALMVSAVDPLAAKPPVMSLQSTKSLDMVAQCIGLALEPIGRPILTRTPEGAELRFGSLSNSPVLVTLSGATPVQVEARQRFALNKKWRNRIRFCVA